MQNNRNFSTKHTLMILANKREELLCGFWFPELRRMQVQSTAAEVYK